MRSGSSHTFPNGRLTTSRIQLLHEIYYQDTFRNYAHDPGKFQNRASFGVATVLSARCTALDRYFSPTTSSIPFFNAPSMR